MPELSELVEVPFSGVNFYRIYVSQQICNLCGGTPVPFLLQQSVRANRHASSTPIAPLFDDLRIGSSTRFCESKGSRWARSFAGSAAFMRAFCIWLHDRFPEVRIVSIVHAHHEPWIWDGTSPSDGYLYCGCDSFAHRLHDRLVCCTVDAIHTGECIDGGQGTHGHCVFEAGTADELDPLPTLQRHFRLGSNHAHVRVVVARCAWTACQRRRRISSTRGRATWPHLLRPASSSVRRPSAPLRRPMRSSPSDGACVSMRHGSSSCATCVHVRRRGADPSTKGRRHDGREATILDGSTWRSETKHPSVQGCSSRARGMEDGWRRRSGTTRGKRRLRGRIDGRCDARTWMEHVRKEVGRGRTSASRGPRTLLLPVRALPSSLPLHPTTLQVTIVHLVHAILPTCARFHRRRLARAVPLRRRQTSQTTTLESTDRFTSVQT